MPHRTSPVTVAPFAETDFDAVVALDAACFAPSGSRSERAAREGQLREEVARTWARLRVARGAPGELLGYIVFWHVTDELHVINVAVAPSARRRGVGRALVFDVLAYGRAHAATKILLEVRASNAPAIALYLRLGFTELNVRRRYYPDGEDAIEMMLAL